MTRMIWFLSLIPFCCVTGPAQADGWHWIRTGFEHSVTAGIADDQTVIVCYSGESNGSSTHVYRSWDRGDTWEETAVFPDAYALSMVQTSGYTFLSLSDSSTAEFKGYILRSDEDGGTWEPCAAFPDTGITNSMTAAHDESLRAVCSKPGENTVLKSFDNGDSWEPGTPLPSDLFMIMEIREFEPDHLFAGQVSGGSASPVWESFNGGSAWVSNTVTGMDDLGMISAIDQAANGRYLISNSMYGGVFYHDSGGSGWTILSTIPGAEGVEDLYVSSQGIIYAAVDASNAGPVWESSDHGVNWREMSLGQNAGSVRGFFESTDGYLYTYGSYLHRSSASIFPPTPTPTTGPGTPTNTPLPPTATGTPGPPTATPTKVPPTAAPTPTIPCAPFGVELDHPDSPFHAGDAFYLNVRICNHLDHSMNGFPLFVILEIEGTFWFAPGWTSSADCYTGNYPSGLSNRIVIQAFSWPDHAGTYQGAVFWCALTNPSVTDILGNYDFWEFGWD